MTRLTRFTATLLSSSMLPLIGCGTSFTTHGSAAPSGLSGKVFGGQNPVSGATVTVWQVGASDYGSSPTALAHATTAADGTFSIPAGSYTCASTDPQLPTQVYITAAGGQAIPGYTNPSIVLAAGLGNCSTADDQVVNINEVTTVVTAFALGNFFTPDDGQTIVDGFGAPSTQIGSARYVERAYYPHAGELGPRSRESQHLVHHH